MSKPTSVPDWIPDNDPAKIIAPSGSKQATGWLSGEKPAFQHFNWFWNLVSKWLQYFNRITAQYNVIIDTADNEGDYTTLAAYLAASPAAGDRVLINTDQTVTGTLIIPAGVFLRMQKGKKFICSANLATVISFASDTVTEGEFLVELSHTGTVGAVFFFAGNDSSHENLIAKNTSTGTVTNAFYMTGAYTCNRVNGRVKYTSSGVFTNILNVTTGGSNKFVILNYNTATVVRNLPITIAEGGTGAITASTARTNLGLGSIATQASNSVSITGGSITGITDLAIADGGTGASNAASALSNLGLTATAAQINSVAVDGKQDSRWIIRGRTSADVHNVLRTGYLYIYDGTDANTIKCNFVAGFNTSTIGAEDNLAKGGSTTSYTLDASGQQVLVKKGALGESVLGILTAHIHYNSSNLTPNIVKADRINGDLYMILYNVTTALDLTTISTGYIVILLSYIGNDTTP